MELSAALGAEIGDKSATSLEVNLVLIVAALVLLNLLLRED